MSINAVCIAARRWMPCYADGIFTAKRLELFAPILGWRGLA
jgi:hypothetical protein